MVNAFPLLRRLVFTPMTDLLRLRLSGRLDWRGRIARSNLDAGVQQVVRHVVARTRLTSRERFDVAGDLISHFQDAADSGISPVDAVADFGNFAVAAKLIGRAKCRQRSLAMWATRVFSVVSLTLMATYSLLIVRYLVGRPTVATDYIAKLNAPALAVPESKRAWPLYREWLIDAKFNYGNADWVAFKPRSEPEAAESWVVAHQPLVARLREITKLASLGFIAGVSDNDPSLFPYNVYRESPQPESLQGSIVGRNFRNVGPVLRLSSVFRIDADVAAKENDGERFEADVTAALNMSAQIRHDATFIPDSIAALKIWNIAVDQLGRVLERQPALLSDAALRRLAHRLNDTKSAADWVKLDGERSLFADLLQRCYTDDGHGDGRLTPKGVRIMNDMHLFRGSATLLKPEGPDYVSPTEAVLGPVAMTVMASRRDMLECFNGLMNEAEQQLGRPSRELAGSGSEADVLQLKRSLPTYLRYHLIATLFPPTTGIQVAVEKALARRDALTIAIAAELFRRQQGRWPVTLTDLTPDYLPMIPLDPVDGRPLRYRVVAGRILIYSIGGNGEDDGGMDLPSERPAKPEPTSVNSFWNLPSSSDWPLFPIPDEPK